MSCVAAESSGGALLRMARLTERPCSQNFHSKITESIQKKHKRGISLDRYVCRDVPLFSLYRKYRVTLKCESHDSYRAKSPSGGSHCGGMESCRLCDPPQAENPASQDSSLFHESKTDYEVKKTKKFVQII